MKTKLCNLSAKRAAVALVSKPASRIHIIDSTFNQHAKWLKVCRDIPWRRSIASLNYLLSSHVWRQEPDVVMACCGDVPTLETLAAVDLLRRQCVLNDIDRFHLVRDGIDRAPHLGARAAYAKQAIDKALIDHRHYIEEHGEDLPAVLNWKWNANRAGRATRSSTEGDNA
jgi:xylulose-5-phosphate/fructose-6-phosphate phosphoketolase